MFNYLLSFFSTLSFSEYMILDTVLLISVIYTLKIMVGTYGEKRILAYFIYFELVHLLLAGLLLVASIYNPTLPTAAFYTAALLIIGASGAETAVFLALFMCYFRITGRTTFTATRRLS